ncbi:MAG: biotin transporter BioY [Gemmatimonadota bacterium]|nr:biotin transporter BioY [Gemmatimonadota bacterium]
MNQHSTLVVDTAVSTRTHSLRRALAVLAFAGLTAIAARMSVPLPGTPIPFTLQPVAVLLSGLLLGGPLGATSQLAYLALGAAGLPVFAAGGGIAYFAGPTGGYLLAFPLAAGIAGFIASDAPGIPRVVLACLAGLFVVHLGGAAWLSLQPWLGGGSIAAFELSLLPFLLGDLLKVVLVAVVALGLGGRVRGRLR